MPSTPAPAARRARKPRSPERRPARANVRGLLSDLLGATRVAANATRGLGDAVESMHLAVQRLPWPLAVSLSDSTRGVTGLVYRSVRGVARLVDDVARALGALVVVEGARPASARRDAMLAALNGVIGDHLDSTGNALAVPMCLRRNGRTLEVSARALASSVRTPRRKVLVLVHGSCRNDLQWRRQGRDPGAALARALGYTHVHLRYNTGLHVSTNGRALAAMLEALVERWPVPVDELSIIAHSMGGLVARSACHYAEAADHGWRRRLRHLVFLGTPHHGAPLERGGNGLASLLQLSPYVAPLARLGRLRSAGVTDLRFGNVLDEDWADRDRFAHAPDGRRPVPLPAGVSCYAIAACRGPGVVGALVGDGLVPVDSALGRHRDPARTLGFPESHRWVARGMGHLDLLDRPEVFARIRAWLAGGYARALTPSPPSRPPVRDGSGRRAQSKRRASPTSS